MEKFKVSVIIPHWERTPEHRELLRRCVKSLPDVYEKIVVYNEGTGMGKAINDGFRTASGDYFLTLSNDCWWESGNLEDLCDPEAVCIPDHLDGQWELPRCFYCMSRQTYEKIGFEQNGKFNVYDEQFEVGYYEDDDFIHRLGLAGIPIKTKPVNGGHIPGQTLDKLPNRQELMDKNKRRFDEKWRVK